MDVPFWSHYFSRLKRVCHTQTLTSTEHHISSLHSHLWVQLSNGSAFPQPDKNDKFFRFFFIIIKEYGSTLYVGLAHAVPPTYTNFQPFLLPTEVFISGWNSTCQPYIESATTLSDYDEELQAFSGCGKALPLLIWTHKCVSRFEI